MANICQTCLTSGRHLLPLKNLQELLQSVGLYEITKKDGGLCWECKSKVINFHKFKQKVLHAQDAISKKDGNLNSLSNLNIEKTFLFDLKSIYNEIDATTHDTDNKPITVKEEVRTEYDYEQNNEDFSNVQAKPLTPMYIEVPAADNNSDLKVEQVLDDDTTNVNTHVIIYSENSHDINEIYLPGQGSSKRKKAVDNTKSSRFDFKNERVRVTKCLQTRHVGFNNEKSNASHMTLIRPVHKGSKLHVCKLCNAVFPSKELASEHIMTHNIANNSEVSNDQSNFGVSISEGSVKFDCRLHKAKPGLPLQIIGDIVIEHDNNQMEVNDGNLTIDHVQKPRQMIEVSPIIEIDADPSYITKDDMKQTENFECNGCKQIFSDRKSLAKHKRRCVKSYRNECHKCGKKFLRPGDLRKHLIKHASKYQHYKCDECGKEFKSKASIRDHMKTHSRKIDKDAYCAECNTQYKSKLMYKYHLEQSLKHVSKEQWKYKCDECPSRFRTPAILGRHVQAVHRNEYNYRCDLCPMKFKVILCLKRHKRRRHGDEGKMRNKICDYCGKAFKDKITLRQHIYAHLGIRPYQCSKCGLSYTHSGSLHTHMKVKHLNKRPQRPYVRRTDKKTKVTHKTCNARQKMKKERDFKKETNPKVCEICGKISKTKAALEQHMNSHLGRRPYKCKLCDAAFSHSGSLHTHNKSVHLKIKVIRNRKAEREKSQQKKTDTSLNILPPIDDPTLDEQLAN